MSERHETPTAMDRRNFLREATLASLPLAFSPLALAGAARKGERRPPARLIVRQKDPENLEFPFSTLDRFITPNELFYIRNHFPVPQLDASTWRLKGEGAVEQPLALSYEDLKQLPPRAVTATLECAGNSRALLEPKVGGVQWGLGAVGNTEWTGVPLSAVLERAGLKDAAVEVVLEGAD